MALTFRMMLTKPVTRQYPEEKREMFPGFRGLHALARKQDGTARCVGCGLCAAVCPSRCIDVYTSEADDHTKIVDRYEIEVLRCVYCGFCVEACPFKAVVLTGYYEYSDYSRAALFMDKDKLLTNWDKYMAGKKGEEISNVSGGRSAGFKAHEDQAVFRGSRVKIEGAAPDKTTHSPEGLNNAA